MTAPEWLKFLESARAPSYHMARLYGTDEEVSMGNLQG